MKFATQKLTHKQCKKKQCDYCFVVSNWSALVHIPTKASKEIGAKLLSLNKLETCQKNPLVRHLLAKIIFLGMMEGAYFVPRKELLAWLNSFYKFSYDKIEQVCTGAAHCQIVDSLFPGQVPLHKVNFSAKFDYEYIKNYKILQEVFNKLNINKVIDVNKLIKGKYQDNLEFLQWMKRFFDMNWQGGEYDANSRRTQAQKDYMKEVYKFLCLFIAAW